MMTLEVKINDFMQTLDDAHCLSSQVHQLIAKMKELYPQDIPLNLIKDFLENHQKINNLISLFDLEEKRSLLIAHLTHTSFGHEFSMIVKSSYERYEFLGDSVLGLLVTTKIVSEFETLSEGELSKFRSSLVNEQALALLGRASSLNEVLLVGRGEFKGGGHQSDANISDIVESLLAYAYTTEGLAGAKRVLEKLVSEYEKCSGEKFFDESRLFDFDPKGKLQEITMKLYKETPRYEHQELKSGEFKVSILLKDQVLFEVSAPSKKKGEREAAKYCLKNKKYIQDNGGKLC